MYNLITHKTNIKSTITKQIDITYIKKGIPYLPELPSLYLLENKESSL